MSITSATRTAKAATQGGVPFTNWIYRDQDGKVIRKTSKIYNFTNGQNFSQKPQPGFVAIRDMEDVLREGRQVALAVATGEGVLHSPIQTEATPGQSKESSMSTTEVTPLVIDWKDEVKGVPADKDGNGFVAAVAGTCRCGCGVEVGKGSKFRPGHDAKYKGMLQRAAIAGQQVIVNGAKAIPAYDAAYTDEFDYRENVQRALDKAAAKGATDEDKAAKTAAKKAERDAAKAEEKAKRDAKRAEDKAARDEEKAKKAEAKRLATLAKAEAADLAKASNGTVDPEAVEEV